MLMPMPTINAVRASSGSFFRLDQNARDLTPLHQHVIRPFELDRHVGGHAADNGIAHRQGHDERDLDSRICSTGGRRVIEQYRFPGGEIQSRPCRPRPDVWLSAHTTAP